MSQVSRFAKKLRCPDVVGHITFTFVLKTSSHSFLSKHVEYILFQKLVSKDHFQKYVIFTGFFSNCNTKFICNCGPN